MYSTRSLARLIAGLSLAAGLSLIAGAASAQTGGGFITNQVLTASGLNTAFSAKQDYLGTSGTGALARVTSPTFVAPALGTPASGVLTNMTGTQKGQTAGSSAAAGQVGEYLATAFATSVATTNGANTNITSLVLSPGDWQVSANCGLLTGASSTSSLLACSITTTSATIVYGADFGMAESIATALPGSYFGFSVGTKRINVSSPTTVYLVGSSTYSNATLTLNGGLQARRVQ